MGAHDIRTLIVDDEAVARRVLREELELIPEIHIVGEAADGDEALRKIVRLKPELVFLDLQMPVKGGFEVVRSLGGGVMPAVVVVTAFDQHAIQAFEAGAIDYLLKPVSEARLRKSVERARTLIGKPLEIANRLADIVAAGEPGGSARSRKIVGRSGEEYFLLDVDEILAFQAERELVWIVTAKQRLLATQPLHTIQERLTDSRFQRVHRNTIVNLDHVRKMTTLSSQRWLLTLSNSLQLVVSKRQARHVRLLLQW